MKSCLVFEVNLNSTPGKNNLVELSILSNNEGEKVVNHPVIYFKAVNMKK